MKSFLGLLLIAAMLLLDAVFGSSHQEKDEALVHSSANSSAGNDPLPINNSLAFDNTTDGATRDASGPHGQLSSRLVAGYFTVPILLVVGLFGNVMSIVVMTRTEFRRMTMSIILIALAFSDTLLIIMQPNNKPFVRRLLTTDLRSYSVISCKIFYWFFRTAKMTSSWLIVLIACERLVAVWFPLKAKIINSKRNISIAVVMVYVGIGSFNGVWSSIADVMMNGSCLPNKSSPELADAAKAFVIAGTLIYSIIPSCIILTMNVMIIIKMAISRRRQLSMATNGNSGQQDQQSRMTAMLLGISLAFIFLVIPISVLHSMATFSGFNPFMSKEPLLVVAREVIQTLEQLNYSINFYLYVLCSKPFRDVVVRLLSCAQSRRRDARGPGQIRTCEVRKQICDETRAAPSPEAEEECAQPVVVVEKSQNEF